MLAFKNLEHETSRRIFYVFHPAHVLLSAVVTAAMFKLHSRKPSLIIILIIGIIGSIGVATLSDSIIPYFGEFVLGMRIHLHEHGDFAHEAHIGFIEGWYIIFP